MLVLSLFHITSMGVRSSYSMHVVELRTVASGSACERGLVYEWGVLFCFCLVFISIKACPIHAQYTGELYGDTPLGKYSPMLCLFEEGPKVVVFGHDVGKMYTMRSVLVPC